VRILAIDAGERRIGLALAEPELGLAQTLGVLERRSRAEDFARLAALVAEHQVGLIVVGQPLAEDGGLGVRARTVGRWAAALARALGAPPPQPAGAPRTGTGLASAPQADLRVVLWDERHSTATAHEIQRAQGRRGRRGRTPIDAVAAAVILQDYLDSQHR
jgi:putative Holliday junction resolvase